MAEYFYPSPVGTVESNLLTLSLERHKINIQMKHLPPVSSRIRTSKLNFAAYTAKKSELWENGLAPHKLAYLVLKQGKQTAEPTHWAMHTDFSSFFLPTAFSVSGETDATGHAHGVSSVFTKPKVSLLYSMYFQ